MKLYYTPGACSLSPHIILRELDLPFELEAVDLRTGQMTAGAAFTTVNPKGYVPALQLDDGEVLTEGTAIIQFLADTHAPGTLAPLSGTIERARLNAHLNFIAAELHQAFGPLFNPALEVEVRSAALANVTRKLDLTEAAFADGRPFLTGPVFSVADAYLFAILRWIPHVGLDAASWPKLGAFMEHITSRPAVQAAINAEQVQHAA